MRTILTICILLFSIKAFGVAKVPSGAGPANWSVSGSWNPAGVPTSADDVTLPAGTIMYFNSAVRCRNLTVDGTLRGQSASGVLSIYGIYTLNGTEDGTGSTLAFFGAGSPAIQGSGTFNTLFIWSFNTSRTIQSTVNSGSRVGLTKIYGGVTVTNFGNVTINTSSLFNTGGGSRWTNGAGATLTLKSINFFSGTTLNYGVFTANAVGNTVNINYPSGNIPNAVSGYYNLSLSSTSVGTKFIPANATVVNNLTINHLNTLNASTYTLNVGGNWINSGSFIAGTGIVNFNGNSSISGTSINAFYDLTISGTLVAPSDNIDISNNWVNNGTYTHNNGTVTFNGTNTVGGSSSTAFNNLIISGTLLGHATNVNVAGSWINNGTFTHNNGTVTFNGTTAITGSSVNSFRNVIISGTLTAPSSANINVAGNWTNNGTFNHNNGTVTFNGTSALSGSSTNSFRNVTISGALTASASNINVSANWINNGTYTHNNGTVTFTGTTAVTGSSITSFGNVTISGTLTSHATNMNVAGNWVNNGTFNHNNGLLTFNGTSAISGSAVTNLNNITITGALTAPPILNVAGNWINDGTFTHNNGLVAFNGITAISGSSETDFGNVLISGSLTAPTTMTINGDFTNDGTFDANSGTITFGTTIVDGSTSPTTFHNLIISTSLTGHSTSMDVSGDFVNDGTYLDNGGQINFNGTTPQTVSGVGTGTFENLSLDNSNGLLINSGTYTLNGTLYITEGSLTNVGSFTLAADATRYARIDEISALCVTCGLAGNFDIQRYIPNRIFGTWANLSSPVSNATMADWDDELFMEYPFTGFSNLTNRPMGSNVMEYDEVSANYLECNSATALSPGKGFEIGLTDDATNTNFSTTILNTNGTPNFGTHDIPLNFTGAHGPAYPTGYAGQNLIGNPFASAIDLSNIIITNALPSVDVYDYETDNYKTLTGSDLIGPYQAFWVYAQSAGASVIIPESAKSTNTSTALERVNTAELSPYLNLTLSSADGSHQMAHTLKIACDEKSSDGFDNTDHPFRKSLNPKAPNITAKAEKAIVSINSFNTNHETYLMPLQVNAGTDGKYHIHHSGIQNVTRDFPVVILEDRQSRQFIDLTSSTAYTFAAQANDSPDRFVIHFSKSLNYKPVATSINNNAPAPEIAITQNQNGNVIYFNNTEMENTTISVIDLLGKRIVEDLSVQALNQTVTIAIPPNFHGMYLIVIQSANNKTVKKFNAMN